MVPVSTATRFRVFPTNVQDTKTRVLVNRYKVDDNDRKKETGKLGKTGSVCLSRKHP
jgi:hypothetical protein